MEEQMHLSKMPRRRAVKRASLVRLIVVREDPGPERPVLSTPEDVWGLAAVHDEMLTSDREVFMCLHLNTKNRLLSREMISMGSLNASIVHPREVFKGALLANAASVILCHNHPSGDPEPSGADIQLTRRLARAGDVIGVEVLDHVIVAESGYVSLRDRGLM